MKVAPSVKGFYLMKIVNKTNYGHGVFLMLQTFDLKRLVIAFWRLLNVPELLSKTKGIAVILVCFMPSQIPPILLHNTAIVPESVC